MPHRIEHDFEVHVVPGTLVVNGEEVDQDVDEVRRTFTRAVKTQSAGELQRATAAIKAAFSIGFYLGRKRGIPFAEITS